MEVLSINKKALDENIISCKHINKLYNIDKSYYHAQVCYNGYELRIKIRGIIYFVWFIEQFRQYPQSSFRGIDTFYTVRIRRAKIGRERKNRDYFFYRKYSYWTKKEMNIKDFCTMMLPKFQSARLNFSTIDLFEIFNFYIPHWYEHNFKTEKEHVHILFNGL